MGGWVVVFLYLDPSVLVNELNDVQMVHDLRWEVVYGVAGEVCDEAHGHFGLPVQPLLSFFQYLGNHSSDSRKQTAFGWLGFVHLV